MAVVFVTFIEILMPSSAIKKYTKVVLGLLVMTIILSPVLNFLKKDFSLSGYSFKYQSQLDSLYIKNQTAQYDDEQSRQVTQLFKRNLEEQIGQYVRKETGKNDVKVNIDMVEDVTKDSFGEIKAIGLTIGGLIKPVEKIDKVSINGKDDNDAKRISSEYEGLKNKISAMYDVEKDRIKINEDE